MLVAQSSRGTTVATLLTLGVISYGLAFSLPLRVATLTVDGVAPGMSRALVAATTSALGTHPRVDYGQGLVITVSGRSLRQGNDIVLRAGDTVQQARDLLQMRELPRLYHTILRVPTWYYCIEPADRAQPEVWLVVNLQSRTPGRYKEVQPGWRTPVGSPEVVSDICLYTGACGPDE
ncbi:MAG: hypothetical protein ACYCW6_02080 [Candidatus Xenobia bacterium]